MGPLGVMEGPASDSQQRMILDGSSTGKLIQRPAADSGERQGENLAGLRGTSGKEVKEGSGEGRSGEEWKEELGREEGQSLAGVGREEVDVELGGEVEGEEEEADPERM